MSADFFSKNNISEGNRKQGLLGSYRLFITERTANKISKDREIISIKKVQLGKGFREDGVFPESNLYCWNSDFFGPLIVPYKGMEIKLNKKNYFLYKDIIEQNEHIKIELISNKILINGAAQSSYIFKNNYYFLLGDNRDNTIDSRFFGFLPESHIVGKCSFIWFSIDRSKQGINSVRWNRLFKECK